MLETPPLYDPPLTSTLESKWFEIVVNIRCGFFLKMFMKLTIQSISIQSIVMNHKWFFITLINMYECKLPENMCLRWSIQLLIMDQPLDFYTMK